MAIPSMFVNNNGPITNGNQQLGTYWYDADGNYHTQMDKDVPSLSSQVNNMNDGGINNYIMGKPQQQTNKPITSSPLSSTTSHLQATGNKLSSTFAKGLDPKHDPNDPWGRYRSGAGDVLNQKFGAGSTDPSDIYRTKLEQMSTGEFDPDDPSYQWRFQQGQQAVERSGAARGLLNSGNAAIELQQYGQGMASQEFQNQFQRTLQSLAGVEDQYNSQYGRLAQMAGVNLDPTATDRLAVAQYGNEVGMQGNLINEQNNIRNNQTGQGANQVNAQGNSLNYKAKLAQLSQEMGMYNDTNAGIRDEMNSFNVGTASNSGDGAGEDYSPSSYGSYTVAYEPSPGVGTGYLTSSGGGSYNFG